MNTRRLGSCGAIPWLCILAWLCGCSASATHPFEPFDSAVTPDGTTGVDGPSNADAAADSGDADVVTTACTSDTQCNDGVACTFDQCLVGTCSHTPQASQCPSGQICDLVMGCIANDGCTGAGVMICGGTCTNTLSDSNNCGACGVSCGTGGLCLSGTCNCGGSLTTCPDGCVDLSSSTTDCGFCGFPCGAGGSCVGGTCACSGGLTSCGDGCVNLATSATDCGTCGNVCGSGSTCSGGVCNCGGGGLVSCGFDGCVNLATSTTDCGTCGNACTPGETCASGTCSCGGGMTSCEFLGCVNLQTDVENCGSCEHECPFGVSCVAGTCTCPAGTSACTDGCVNMATDPLNCGGCGMSCSSGATCTAGRCACPGVAGMVCPTAGIGGPQCTDVSSDVLNCGACGNNCGAGATCTGGHCGCASGSTLCGVACANLLTDGNNCGACGVVCAGACSGGHCTTIAEIAGGYEHACAVIADGTVQCWGGDGAGQLGSAVSGTCIDPEFGGTVVCSQTPVAVPGLSGVVEVEAGSEHTCARSSDGTVRCWGANDSGQLGYSTITTCPNGGEPIPCSPTPTAVSGLSGVAQLALGDAFSCARMSDGTVKCWGDDFFGEAGSTATTTCTDGFGDSFPCVPSATAVPGLSGVVSIVAGAYHACALRTDGTVWCWGSDDAGQLGFSSVTECGASEGEPSPCTPEPTAVPGLSGVIALAAGSEHTCAVLTGGTVKCWGDNTDGSLGYTTLTTCESVFGSTVPCSSTPTLIPSLTGVAAVALGQMHGCAVTTGGAVSCWGSAANGRLGTGTMPMCNDMLGEPTAACSLVPLAVTGLSGVTHLAAGNDSMCSLGTDGSVRCWGLNASGQIGNGSTSDALTPVHVDL